MKLGISSKGSGISQIATAGALCALRKSAIVPNFAVTTGLFSYIVALFSIYNKDEDILKRLCEMQKSMQKISRAKRIGFILFPKIATRDLSYKIIKRDLGQKTLSSLDVKQIITSADILTSAIYIYSPKRLSSIKNAIVVTDELLHNAIRSAIGGCSSLLPFLKDGRYMVSSLGCMLSQGALLSSLGAEKTLEIEVISNEKSANILELSAGVSHQCESELQKQDKWRADYKLTIDVSDIDVRDKNSAELLFKKGYETAEKIVGDLLFSLYI